MTLNISGIHSALFVHLIVSGGHYIPSDRLSRGVVIQLIMSGGALETIRLAVQGGGHAVNCVRGGALETIRLAVQGGGHAVNCVRGGIRNHSISCPGGWTCS